MQPQSPPPPFRRPAAAPHALGPAPGGPRSDDRNEFADAVARMFEHRRQLAPEFAPPRRDDVRIRGEFDEAETPRASVLRSLVGPTALRRALSIVPLAIIGYGVAWFLYFEPSQDVTAKPLVEVKPEVVQAAPPAEVPPPERPEVAVAKPAPAPAATSAAPVAPAPPPAVAAPSRPLSKDEIKELQGRLGAAGFTVGPIDGVVGPQTQAALRRYAQSRNLAKPEAIQETLLRLRSEIQTSR